ncbi:MAG: type II secretion system F family protein [Eubacteriales bacterium]
MIMLITYLFYHSLWAVVLFLPMLLPYIKWWEYQQELKKKSEFQLQFRDYLQALMAALRTGYALENAISEGKRDLRQQYEDDARIIQDIGMIEGLLSMNIPIEQAWKEWANELNIEVLSQFTTVFMIAKKSGGDSIAIIQNAISNICETVEIEMEISVILAGKKMEFYIMSFVPLGIILYMKLCFSQFMGVLYGNAFGIILMTICLGIYVLAFWWGNKMIQIEV